MTKRIALLSLVALVLAAAPAALATRHDTPKPGTPAALAAKVKAKTAVAKKFAHLYVVKCHTSVTSNPSGPVVTLPVCTKRGAAIVAALQKLDQAIQKRLANAPSGTRAATLLQKLDTRLQTVLSHVQATIAPSATTSGDSGNA